MPDDLRAIDIWIGEADYPGQGFDGAMMKLAIARCSPSDNVRQRLAVLERIVTDKSYDLNDELHKIKDN